MTFNDLYLRYEYLAPFTAGEIRTLLPCLRTELMLWFNQPNMEWEFEENMVHIHNIQNVSLSSIRRMLQAVRSLTKNGKPLNTPKKVEALENKIDHILINHERMSAEIYNHDYTEEHYNEEERSKYCCVIAPCGSEVKQELLEALELSNIKNFEMEEANDNVYVKHLPMDLNLTDFDDVISDFLANNIDYE